MKPPFLAYDVSTCRNCGEPILRPVTRQDADVLLRWLHTPKRLYCLNPWREVLPSVAGPAAASAPVVRLPRSRIFSDVRRQGRWAA